MEDYTKKIEFWKRLQSFVSDVQTNCCMGEEEKKMIMLNCELKILDIQRVSNAKRTFCNNCKSGLIDYPEIGRRTCRCGALGYNVTE